MAANAYTTNINQMHKVHLFQRFLNIMHPDLRRIDLNLLVVFEALVRHRSVTAAADELAMSPSALSHALARLRGALSDELFVRVGQEMSPTAAAERMVQPVSDALKLLAKGLAQTRSFDPADSDRTFIFAATDYTAFAVLPAFIARMQDVAPNLRFRIIYSSGRESAEDLVAGRVDFALGYTEEIAPLPPGIESFDWFSDDYVVIANRHHLTIRGTLSLAQYLSARHVVVTPWNETRGSIDYVLDKLNHRREVAVQLPSVLAAPFIIANSALLLTAPRHAAQTLQGAAPIKIYPVPFAIPRYTLKVYGHVKHARTEAHTWIREQLLKTLPDAQRTSRKS